MASRDWNRSSVEWDKIAATSKPTPPAVFCACGAQWHGKYADRVRNPVIDDHARRRYDVGCRLISEAQYVRRFPRRRRRATVNA